MMNDVPIQKVYCNRTNDAGTRTVVLILVKTHVFK